MHCTAWSVKYQVLPIYWTTKYVKYFFCTCMGWRATGGQSQCSIFFFATEEVIKISIYRGRIIPSSDFVGVSRPSHACYQKMSLIFFWDWYLGYLHTKKSALWVKKCTNATMQCNTSQISPALKTCIKHILLISSLPDLILYRVTTLGRSGAQIRWNLVENAKTRQHLKNWRK